MTNRIRITGAALMSFAVFGGVNSASAFGYTWGPPNIVSHVKGRLLFNPQGGRPFRCRVNFTVKTGNQDGVKNEPRIVSAVAMTGTGCNNTLFEQLPWGLGAGGPTAGDFGNFTFLSPNGSCQASEILFTANPNGDWTLPAGACIVGSLTSTPPIMIIPRP